MLARIWGLQICSTWWMQTRPTARHVVVASWVLWEETLWWRVAGRTLRRVFLGSTHVEGRGRKGQKKKLGSGAGPVNTSADLSWGALELGCVCRIVASWGEEAGPSPLPWPCCQLFYTGWSWKLPSAKAFSKEGWQPRVMAAFPEVGGVTAFLKGHLVGAAQHPSLPNSRTRHKEEILKTSRWETQGIHKGTGIRMTSEVSKAPLEKAVEKCLQTFHRNQFLN